jgi:hypothetical protein
VDADYVNNRREVSNGENETLCYNPETGDLKQFASFTPEYYGSLFGSMEDKQLITFKKGVPYFHYDVNRTPAQTTYLNFYGVQCDAVFEVVMNAENEKVKKFMYTEVYCREQKFFADRILTQARQSSRLLLDMWERRDNFFVSDFKCDLNTFRDPNLKSLQDSTKILYEGDTLFGTWIKVRYVGEPSRSARYCELNGIAIFVTGSEKSGLK